MKSIDVTNKPLAHVWVEVETDDSERKKAMNHQSQQVVPSFRQQIHWSVFCVAAWLVMGFVFPQESFGSETKLCVQHFRKKQYIRASQCFQDLAQELEKKSPRTNALRRKIGTYLRNAALALRKDAANQKGLRVFYLNEQAYVLYQKVLKDKLYEFKSQRRLVKIALDKIEAQIGYRQVIVLTGSSKAKVQIVGGYRFKSITRTGQQFQLRLRPGTYTFLASYPKSGSHTRTLTVKPKQPVITLKFKPQPLPIRRKPPTGISRSMQQLSPGVWVMIALGSTLVAGGVITVGVAAANKSSTDSWGEEQKKLGKFELDVTRRVRDGIDSANTQLTAGMVVGGTGLLAIVVGGLWYAARPKPQPPKPPKQGLNSAPLARYFSE